MYPTARNRVIYNDDMIMMKIMMMMTMTIRGSYDQPLAFQPLEKLWQKSQLQFFKGAAAAAQRLKITKLLLG